MSGPPPPGRPIPDVSPIDHRHARNVILGAGAMGAAAAYHLARRGEPVLLVEQFEAGHDRGSSHGAARIIRHSYADVLYSRLMPEAFAAWRRLEAEAGELLYVKIGGLSLCPPGVDYVARVASSLEEVGVPHRRLRGAEVRRAYPSFAVPDEFDAVFEPDAGLISASRAIAAQIELARRLGAGTTEVLERCPIRRIDLDGERPALLADRLRITADRLIVAAGPWAGRLLPGLADRLRPTRQQVLYLGPDPIGPFAIGRLPAFICKGASPSEAFYGMPDFLGTGVKVARHSGPDCDPDAVDRAVDASYVDLVRDFLRGVLPSLADAPLLRSEVCLYTEAPDAHFLLGPLPGRPGVIVASPCSGHGFKFSCLIGRILADLALDDIPGIDIDLWRPGGHRGDAIGPTGGHDR
ncbi:N-methyl-L-tryptophan oxidase [Tautonia plasticadhaerens]|uniref:Monomeric sarcosine oxidase n=1 Tax=Tautonia plasticadhaerens TaxID=2527974 RepID=A0A518H1E2_9BACT|nr:N-methyl-L-tryptophan oxidase [Tautonia plasticadhaerens]QDV34665.1 Monomeric sarcosine oxidase [Tautonia plasticadhaerens]